MQDSADLPYAPVVATALLLAALAGCGSQATVSDAAPGEQAGGAAARQTLAPAAPSTARAPARLAASHVLIQWSGADRAGTDVTRTREEALKLAGEIAAKARAGEDITTLAKEYSDGPSAPQGGDLGMFASSQIVDSALGPALKSAYEVIVGGFSRGGTALLRGALTRAARRRNRWAAS